MGWLDAADTIITIVTLILVIGLFVLKRVRSLRARFAGLTPNTQRPTTIPQPLKTNAQRPTPRIARRAAPQRAVPAPIPPVPAREPAPLPLADWWTSIVAHEGHVMLIGETRSGKSTTARALLAERARTDAIFIIDPHAKFADWAGLPVVGGRNIEAIESAFHAIHAEFERRFEADQPVGDPMTVFIDEYLSIAARQPQLVVLVKQWLRESAKARMRFVFLGQDRSVKGWGIEGEGDVRKSMRTVLLGTFAAEASELAARQERPAALDYRGSITAVSVSGLPFLASRPIDASVMWSVPVPSSPPVEASKTPSEAVGTGELGNRGTGEPEEEPGRLSEKRAAVLRRMHADGYTMTDIATAIGGKRTTTLALIRQALADVETTAA